MFPNAFLEPYLISIGVELVFHPWPTGPLGLTREERFDVMVEYLYNICDFTPLEVLLKFKEEKDIDIIDAMKGLLSDGVPVIYSAFSNIDSSAGHCLIAYGIDDNGNILLHTGWERNEYQVLIVEPETENEYDQNLITEFTLDKSIMWLEINEFLLPHSHSYSYTDTVTDEPLCSCQIYETHPEHGNNHLYNIKTDSEKQYEECHCGDMNILHTHDKSYTSLNSTEHYEACQLCDYCANETHTASMYVKKNNMSHYIVCECGYTIETASHTLVFMGGTRYRCVDCGALFNSSSDIIIKKDDSEYEVE